MIDNEKIELSNKIDAQMEAGDLDALKKSIDANPEVLDWKVFNTGQYGLIPYAAGLGQTKICEFLLARGADVNEATDNVDTPLHEAAGNGHFETTQWLLAHGASVDGPAHCVTSPLINAIISGHTDVAKLLIDHGADINRLHTRQHQMPLDFAIKWGRTEIESLLRSKGAESVAEEKDWSKEYGGPILNFINQNFGRVLPISLTGIIVGPYVEQRVALVNKQKNKLLFTLGLFDVHKPMLELFIVLPAEWNMTDRSDANQFPTALLLKLSDQISKGLHIDEGFLVLADDPEYKGLCWPGNIGGFQVTDCHWGSDREKDDAIPAEDRVGLWTLVPIKRGKSGLQKQSLEKNRSAGWAKLTLNLN